MEEKSESYEQEEISGQNASYNQIDQKEYQEYSVEKKKVKEKGSFLGGFFVGFIICLILACGIFSGYKLFQMSREDKRAEVSIVNEKSTEKMQALENIINGYYYKEEDIDKTAMVDGMYKGLLDSLGDPYSVYYTEDELNELMESSSGVYYGIGAYLSLDEATNCARISGVISNTPAEEIGLRENDIIYKVDDEVVQGLTLEEIVARVKGEEGTMVHLTIVRDGESDYLELDVMRRKIESPTVKYEMLENQIGYIQITEFDDVTGNQFTDAYATIKGNNAKGLIIDLRSNPGGNLLTVVDIARQILPKGLIVYTEDRQGERMEYDCDGENEIQIPLVVLVNGNSASASEILAGAIKDYGIGKLVGTTTFGKGIVQRVITLSDGTAVKLTVSAYYTPNGNNIHGIGIEPDVEVTFDGDAYYNDGYDNQLEKAKDILLGEIK